MQRLDVDRVVSGLKRKLQEEKSSTEEKTVFVTERLSDVLNCAALQPGGALLSQLKSALFHSGVLDQCVSLLDLKRAKGNWSAAAALAQLLSSCCVGAEPGDRSEAFDRLFLPSVMSALLSLAARLMKQTEGLFKKVLDAVSWLLQNHLHLTAQVLSSVQYEKLQVSEDSSVSLLCLQLWTQTICSSRDAASALSDDALALLLNDAVSQLAVSSEATVGGAAVGLLLLLARQLRARLLPLLRDFRGLDSLLRKDWRGRGFDQEVDQLIEIIQSRESSEDSERAACVIQAAWRSFRTRTRVRSLHRAVSSLQRRYRARRRQQEQQQEAQRWEEELRYQVGLRRQKARRKFHLKQRQLLQLLPPEQVRPYLQECERRAAVLIQSQWRGFRDRQQFNQITERLRREQREERAAVTLQRAIRRFLSRRRAARAPPSSFWIGQKGLTDRRRAELKKQVEDYITLHPSRRVAGDECRCFHDEVQRRWITEAQSAAQRRRQEEKILTVLAHTSTLLRTLREAPPLSSVSQSEAALFLSPLGAVAARARDSHNALLQAESAPWWRILGNQVHAAGHAPGHAPSEELEAESAPWWRILGNQVHAAGHAPSHAPSEELEAELRSSGCGQGLTRAQVQVGQRSSVLGAAADPEVGTELD